jgi:rubrerythrin
MSNYQPHWDLTTIPDPEWSSEHGRRQRAKGPQATYQVLKPCNQCGAPLNATQRRKPCPECGHSHSRKG